MACRLTVLAASAALAGLSACTVRTTAGVPAYAYGAPAVVQPYDSYCAQAVDEAQDAAARAALTGTELAAGRARRTAHYAQRDCR